MPRTKTGRSFPLVFSYGRHLSIVRCAFGRQRTALDALMVWSVDPRLNFSIIGVLKASPA